jgi:hypothetical protein
MLCWLIAKALSACLQPFQTLKYVGLQNVKYITSQSHIICAHFSSIVISQNKAVYLFIFALFCAFLQTMLQCYSRKYYACREFEH